MHNDLTRRLSGAELLSDTPENRMILPLSNCPSSGASVATIDRDRGIKLPVLSVYGQQSGIHSSFGLLPRRFIGRRYPNQATYFAPQLRHFPKGCQPRIKDLLA